MEFNELGSFTKIGLEGATCVLMVVIAYKIYRMKLHTLSKCCKGGVIIETMNKGNSSRDLEFTNLRRPTLEKEKDDDDDELESAII